MIASVTEVHHLMLSDAIPSAYMDGIRELGGRLDGGEWLALVAGSATFVFTTDDKVYRLVRGRWREWKLGGRGQVKVNGKVYEMGKLKEEFLASLAVLRSFRDKLDAETVNNPHPLV